MAKYLIFIVFWVLSESLNAQAPYPCPTNGNAESGDLSNWNTYLGNSSSPSFWNNWIYGYPTNISTFSSGADPVRINIADGVNSSVNSPAEHVNGIDLVGNFTIPNEGNYCIRVGNNKVGGEAEAVRYTFVVTEQNKYFKLRYALVLQDGGHQKGNPLAFFYFVKGAKLKPITLDIGIINQTMTTKIANVNDPFFTQASNGIAYKKWECLEFDLSSYVGQQVSLVAGVRDCTESAHFGYMYLDGLCTEWPAVASGSLEGTTFCLEQDIILNGSQSTGEDSYWIEVAEINQSYAYVPGGLLVQSDWFLGQEAPSSFNVTSFLASKGVSLECGKKYKVKLVVANRCTAWNEVNLVFDIVCPQIDAGTGATQCCFGEGVAMDYPIGSQAITGNTYSWTSIPAGYSSSSANASVTPTGNIAYIVQMTQPNGCIGRDTVLFRVIPNDLSMSLETSYKLCDYKPYITANLTSLYCNPDPSFAALFGEVDLDNYLTWYFTPENSTNQTYLGTGKTIQAPNQNGTVKGELVFQECNISISRTIPVFYRPGGGELIAPNAFTPDGDTFNSVFRILEYGPDAPSLVGDGPAYGISDFNLRFWNRYGVNFLTVSKDDVGRAPDENVYQGDISWDGVLANGSIAQDGVYNYTLELKFCGQETFQKVCLPNAEVDRCVEWFWFICTRRLYGCSNHVTLVR